MAQAHGFGSAEKNKLLALYRASGISRRHSVISDYAHLKPVAWSFYPHSKDLRPFPTTGDRSRLYKSHALQLSLQAVKDCLKGVEIASEDITHIITVSCTGMYAPGLDIDLVKSLGLATSIQRTSINFMGCYAALTAIKTADAICKSQPQANVLIVTTELCTIHFQNKTDDDNLLANAIFSDGSAAMIMSGESSKVPGMPKLSPKAFHCELLTDGEKDMAWNIGDFGFEMKLSAYVPNLVQNGIRSLISRLTSGLQKSDISQYAIHPGGKKILTVIEEELGIEKSANQFAHQILRQYGNMSSPTVLFVLKEVMNSLSAENEGDNILSLAFGPGLTLESVLFEVK